MYYNARTNWCSVFEAMDACSTIDDFGALVVTSVAPALGCMGGSLSEVIYSDASPRLHRHFVTGYLEKAVRSYIVNFEKISESLFGGPDRDKLSIYLMETLVDRALEYNFDPRPIWRGIQVRNILTMRIACTEKLDFYFTFNRSADGPAFEDSDLQDARQLFAMLSATSRRLLAEERLYRAMPLPKDSPHSRLSEEKMLGVIRRDAWRYQLSRFAVSQLGSQACFKSADESSSRTRTDVVRVKPSNADFRTELLTPAEDKVARLVAQGLSNKDIARQQSLSVYTVENHLKSIYRKLEVQGRGKLAATFLHAH